MAKKNQIRLADDFLNIQVDTLRINPNRTCDWTKAWNVTSEMKIPYLAKSRFAGRFSQYYEVKDGVLKSNGRITKMKQALQEIKLSNAPGQTSAK